jgi:hypothetical protein
MKFDLTRIYDITPLLVKNVAMKVCGVLQKERPEVFLAGFACMFVEVCRVMHVEPRAVLDASDRIMRAAEDRHPVELRALRRFITDDIVEKRGL